MKRHKVYLKLGRVSNLPTVVTNVIAGALLSGTELTFAHAPLLLLVIMGMCAFYVGGMFLNDAFDRKIDAIERPERPIPAGLVTAEHVLAIGFALLASGIALTTFPALLFGFAFSLKALSSSIALAAAIVFYNLAHKGKSYAPWVMGSCRALVYLTSAFALGGTFTAALGAGALGLLLYITGLTYVARYETRADRVPLLPALWVLAPLGTAALAAYHSAGLSAVWWCAAALLAGWTMVALWPALARRGRASTAVVRLIAGVSLFDALVASAFLGSYAILLGVAAVVATLSLQKVARGT